MEYQEELFQNIFQTVSHLARFVTLKTGHDDWQSKLAQLFSQL